MPTETGDSATIFAARIASATSVLTLISCFALYTTTITEIERLLADYEQLIESFEEEHQIAYDDLQSLAKERSRRATYLSERPSYVEYGVESGAGGGKRGRARGRDDDEGGPNWSVPHRHRTSSHYEPRICDCTIIQCPHGPRGPPGADGAPAEDGHPGVPGRPGVDGVFLGEEFICPPCPAGPRGEDGPQGEPGEQGRPGIPGIPGPDGTNEPGPIGAPGSRGQSGRPGKKGIPGEPGQDAVQLIGLPGPKGVRGPPGFPGPRGDPGISGIPAPPGLEGPPGSPGETGDPGEFGLRGAPGRKGPPGEDGGYCQCPPREGTGVAEGAGLQRLPGSWEEYKLEPGRVGQRALSDGLHQQHYKRRKPPTPTKPQNSNDDYPSNRQTSRKSYRDPTRAHVWRSPNSPMISYRDSRELPKKKSKTVQNHCATCSQPENGGKTDGYIDGRVAALHRLEDKKKRNFADAIEFELRARL